MSTSDKIKAYILIFLSKYLVWIIFAIVLIIYWFFPNLIQVLGKIILFWAPAIILIFGLITSAFKINFKAKRDQEQGINQYEIIITSFELLITDLIVYGGTFSILLAAYVFNDKNVNPSDLIQAILFFFFTNLIKKVFTNKQIQ